MRCTASRSPPRAMLRGVRGATGQRRRGALAALVLAGGAIASQARPATVRRAVRAPRLDPSALVAAPSAAAPVVSPEPHEDPPFGVSGERSADDGSWWLGVQPARGSLALPVPGAEPAGAVALTLWPPAAVWPSGRQGALWVEHGPLAPGVTYRLDVAWPGGETRHARFVTAPLREVIARGPEVGRVDPRAAIWARLGADVDRASVEASFRLTPPVRGRIEWPDEHTVRLVPDERLPWGELFRVEVGGTTSDGWPLRTAVWKFRTLIPPPAEVIPGNGAPVALTFDDGTDDVPQAWRLLDLLQRHEVRAILFPTGAWARKHPLYLERARREGHRVCNHTATHAHLSDLPDDRIETEILGGAGHGECDLLRPPAMATSERVERVAARLGYRMFLWHVDSRDWEGLPAEDIVNRVLARVRPGAVVLFHMHAMGTLDALPRLVIALRTAGYRLTYEGADDTLTAAGGIPTSPDAGHAPPDPPAP